MYTGPLWTDFSATHITIINQSTTIINVFTLYDPTNGMLYTKTPGLHGRNGPYIGPSTSTTTQPTTPSPNSTGSTAAQPPAPGPTTERPSVSLSPNPVTQGDTVTLTASGFAPRATLEITVNRPDGVVEHYPLTAGAGGTMPPRVGAAAALDTQYRSARLILWGLLVVGW
ncbi:MAG: hypothetical protein ACXVH3_36010 [Solirubrobacteraceae bacterium]